MRVGFFLLRENPLIMRFFWNDSDLFIMVILPGRHTGEQCSNWLLTSD